MSIGQKTHQKQERIALQMVVRFSRNWSRELVRYDMIDCSSSRTGVDGSSDDDSDRNSWDMATVALIKNQIQNQLAGRVLLIRVIFERGSQRTGYTIPFNIHKRERTLSPMIRWARLPILSPWMKLPQSKATLKVALEPGCWTKQLPDCMLGHKMR